MNCAENILWFLEDRHGSRPNPWFDHPHTELDLAINEARAAIRGMIRANPALPPLPPANEDRIEYRELLIEWCVGVQAAIQTVEKAAEKPANVPAQDGPQLPDTFRFAGKEATVKGYGFKLLDCLWTARNRTAPEDVVMEAVWGDNGDRENALKMMIYHTNVKLLKKQMSLMISRSGGCVTIR